MARSMSNKDGMGMGPKKPTRGGVEKRFITRPESFSLPKAAAASADSVIKIAKSAADLAKMGYKIVPIPGKKKK